MRECSYILSIIYNMIPFTGGINSRRDICAQIFILSEREIKKRENETYRFEVQNIEINALIKKEKEKLTNFFNIF